VPFGGSLPGDPTMHPSYCRLALALLLLAPALPGRAQDAPRKYLAATSHYLHAETVALSRLPEPPKPGSLAAEVDLETILQLQAWRTEAEVAWAVRMDQLDVFDAAEVIGTWFTRERLPKCARLLEEALGDGESLNHIAKLKFKRLRPPFQDPRVHPCMPVQPAKGPTPSAGFYSFPSGHATSIYLAAELLAELVPTKREPVQAWAHKAAWSRMLAGVHFPSDDLGGRILAEIGIQALMANPAFVKALEACKEEVRTVQPSGPSL